MRNILMIISLGLLSFDLFAQALNVDHISDLNFQTVVQGDTARRVRAQNNESNAARFLVTGPRRTRYQILLPSSISLNHLVIPSSSLTVDSFESRPSPTSGRLNNQGEEEVIIGATLQAIPQNQRGGGYRGTFLIEVILQ